MKIRARDLFMSWGKVMCGHVPMLGIEVTRECPLRCPGCYAYSDSRVEGDSIRQTRELRGDDLVGGILRLVECHGPLHVSLIGGEPMIRHRELSRVLPVLSRRGIVSMVVTSGVLPIPREWMELPRVIVAVSVDGLATDHDLRRAPATYERILDHIANRKVSIHWTVLRSHIEEPGYMDAYLAFWSARPEVERILLSLYSPLVGEDSPERLTSDNRETIRGLVPDLRSRYPKLLVAAGMAQAYASPPLRPEECYFSRMSVNYTADCRTRIGPCILGAGRDCNQCGCAISVALHWIAGRKIAGPLRIGHVMECAVTTASIASRLRLGVGGNGKK